MLENLLYFARNYPVSANLCFSNMRYLLLLFYNIDDLFCTDFSCYVCCCILIPIQLGSFSLYFNSNVHLCWSLKRWDVIHIRTSTRFVKTGFYSLHLACRSKSRWASLLSSYAFRWLSGYMHIRGVAYFIICMKLENGELSLLTFFVRYSTISSVYNMGENSCIDRCVSKY